MIGVGVLLVVARGPRWSVAGGWRPCLSALRGIRTRLDTTLESGHSRALCWCGRASQPVVRVCVCVCLCARIRVLVSRCVCVAAFAPIVLY